jgi:CheY-like chemotaxis protein
MQAVLKAGRSAGSLTRQLLTFSRKQMLLPRVLDLNDIVCRMEKLLRRTIGEDIELVVRLTEPLNRVSADPGQIEQVLMNLAINGRDAMAGGGTLTIETANVTCDEGDRAKHPGVSPGAHAMIAVTDTGTGMDQDVLAHLFEPFYTTKGVGQGTGLGLASVYGIVQQSGGSISVSSEVGCGSTFRIYFPDVAADVPVVPAAASVSLRGVETILLVEDQDDVRSIVRATLMRHGYTVIEAARPEIALRVAEEESHFDLLLTDVVMPTMSGRGLARQLQQRRRDLRVVYMSGYTDGAIVHHGVLDPSVAFIQKPFTPDSLLRKVREALDRRNS